MIIYNRGFRAYLVGEQGLKYVANRWQDRRSERVGVEATDLSSITINPYKKDHNHKTKFQFIHN